MKTTCLLTLTAALCSLSGIAVADTVIGSGRVVSETRNVTGFHGVNLQGSGGVIVTQGDTEGLVIEAEDNLLPLLDSTVGADGVLHLGFKPHEGSIESKKDVVYKVAVKDLDRLEVEGSGSIRAASLSTGALVLKLPGSGGISVDHLKAPELKLELEGSGTVTLAGEVPRQSVTIDGSGEYHAKTLASSEAKVEINGSGEASVFANETLKVEINGSGEVTYHGSAKLTKHINGSGKVNASNAKDE